MVWLRPPRLLLAVSKPLRSGSVPLLFPKHSLREEPLMTNNLFPWTGSKRKLARHILPLFPAHTCYVEPFCGSAALFFRKEPSKAEILNDINGDLINLYRVIKHHLDEFNRQLRWSLTSRQLFDWLQLTTPDTLTDIQRAARFFYLQHMAFGGKVSGQTFGTSTTRARGLNLLRIEETLSEAHLRLSAATIEHLDWQACIKRYDRPDTLFYLDPPYWKTAGYGVPFGMDEYVQMAALAREIKGRMLISINDTQEMRECFAGLNFREVNLTYSLGSNSQKARELLISNYPI